MRQLGLFGGGGSSQRAVSTPPPKVESPPSRVNESGSRPLAGLRGSVSAPGIFFDPCPTGDLSGGAPSAVRAQCNYLDISLYFVILWALLLFEF